MPADFHEVLFPLDVSLRGSGGPVRLTEIVTLASGRDSTCMKSAESPTVRVIGPAARPM